ncbi:MAG: cytochrome c biogenesis protein CcsA [bacterium]|nr:cytochrome c biogenesis protein CcsA [candidate division KSB1 bacterium]MDH7559792.1 cytochrome c biogenesis protein CcsA [bacterium]
MSAVAVVVAVACGVATFIENSWGHQAARAEVYETWWFTLLLAILALSALANFMKRHWWRPDKVPAGLIHTGVVVILVGAALTRHFGREEFVHIREGESTAQVMSDRAYLTVSVAEGDRAVTRSVPAFFSPRRKPRLSVRVKLGHAELTARALCFMAEAVPSIEADPTGGPAVLLTAVDGERRRILALRPGDVVPLEHAIVTCGTVVTDTLPVFRLAAHGDSLTFCATQPVTRAGMRQTEVVALAAHAEHPVHPLHLYTVGQLKLALRSYLPHARLAAVPAKEVTPAVDEQDVTQALEVEVAAAGERRVVTLFGGAGTAADTQTVHLAGLTVALSFGSASWPMPFALRLTDFLIERYPGSDRPSMFISKVVVVDNERGTARPAEVFMNHPLRYRGYRFYQASYDDDERGTVLNATVDPGVPVVYAGFVLLGGGLLAWLLWPVARRRKAAFPPQLAGNSGVSIVLLICLCILLPARRPQAPEAGKAAHLRAFARLPVLDVDGRCKPMDTFAREIVRKVSLESKAQGLPATEVLLGMMARPEQWRHVPMIYVEDEDVRRTLGLPATQRHARFVDFFDRDGRYRLTSELQAVHHKSPAEHTRHDRELLKVDERASICYMALRGLLPRLFPHADQPARWLSYAQAQQELSAEKAGEVRTIYQAYLQAARQAAQDGSWPQADQALQRIVDYQRRHAPGLIPAAGRLGAEVLFNRVQPFQRLLFIYLGTGLVLLLVTTVATVRPGLFGRGFFVGARLLLLVFFLGHSAGLALRWYVSGHAPWSNGYETTVYISWTAALAGLLLSRRSLWLPAATSLLAAAALFVAHLSGMDPQITPLVPVLKSRWLVIHVSTVTASYGFLGLAAALALLGLALRAFSPGKAVAHFGNAIAELSVDTMRLLKVGFVLLVLGTMFGSVWANASWGRYWGWDPKETWTLITILTYAVVIHLRQGRRLAGRVLFSVAAVLAFGSVLMTYFGVNYYLTGLHSYAQGEPSSWPPAVYIVLGGVGALIVAASLREMVSRAKS